MSKVGGVGRGGGGEVTEQEKEKLVKQVDMALRCLGKHAAVLIKLVSSAKPQPSAVPPTTAIGVICEMERFVGEKEGACAVLTSAVALRGPGGECWPRLRALLARQLFANS